MIKNDSPLPKPLCKNHNLCRHPRLLLGGLIKGQPLPRHLGGPFPCPPRVVHPSIPFLKASIALLSNWMVQHLSWTLVTCLLRPRPKLSVTWLVEWNASPRNNLPNKSNCNSFLMPHDMYNAPRTGAEQITQSFEPKSGAGRIFIGFRTSQTTGLAARHPLSRRWNVRQWICKIRHSKYSM